MLPSISAQKNQVLTVACVTLGVISLGLAGLNYLYIGAHTFAAIELIFSLFCFYVLVESKKNIIRSWHYPSIAAFFTFIIMYGLTVSKVSSALILWTFCLPLLYHLFFNRYVGSLLTLAVLVTCLTVVNQNHVQTNPFAFLNFSLPYITVWIISFAYEEVRERVQHNLQTLALTDSLTEAKNRLCLLHDTSHELAHRHNLYLFHFDLDHFKKINDSYGHSCGDTVLKSTCEVIQETAGSDKLYRVGGEEFCIVFEASDVDSAFHFSEMIRKSIEKNIIYDNEHSLNVTISGGLVPLSLSEHSVDTALQQTDKALYQAKLNGRNQVILA